VNAAFTPLRSLAGGIMIGGAAALMLLAVGRIAGITGIVGGALRARAGDVAWRLWFLAGLAGAGLVLGRSWPAAFGGQLARPGWWYAVAGLLVGFGTRLGNGCTSGHGVCGIARLSRRSLVATAVFMLAGAVTVFFVRHAGGAS
jgi:uncharacterized membrane protein YedE/YeeE